MGSILLALGKWGRLDVGFLAVLDQLANSRMGLFVHEGSTTKSGDIILRELVTNDRYECSCPAGYAGFRGELWLARVLPPPLPTLARAAVVTTPYVILAPGVQEWKAYLDRTLPTIGIGEPKTAYHRLMKYGLHPRHWSEYIFEGFVNYRTEASTLPVCPIFPKAAHTRASMRYEP